MADTSTQETVIRPVRPEDEPAVVEIVNALRPEYAPMTLEEYRGYFASLPADTRMDRIMAEREGVVAGHGSLMRSFFAESRDSYSLDLEVHPDHWGHGVGTKLYDRLLATAMDWGVKKLYSQVRADRPRSLAFAEHRGFVPTGHDMQGSRLEVASANLEGYEGLSERLESEGIRITTLAEMGDDEDTLRRVYASTDAIGRDVPSAETMSVSYEVWRDSLLAMPGMSPESYFVAVDGDRPIGVAVVQRTGVNAAGNAITGVEREYRGRGVARALKQRTVEWARQNGIEFFYTGNDATNERMLAINIRMGYQPLPVSREVMKEL